MSEQGNPGGPANTPAGWYAVGDGTQRYWDGDQWTEHISPAPGQAPVEQVPFSPAVAGQAGDITSDDRTMAMLAHLLSLVGGFLAPLIIWLVKKDQSTYVDYHGKESLNFQLTMMLYYLGAFILSLVLIGLLVIPVLMVLSFVMPIIGGLAANKNEYYRYPLTIRFVK